MNKTVLITGASGGIGRALVRGFANAGYNVGIHYYRNREGAEAALRDARRAGVEANIYQADAGNLGSSGNLGNPASPSNPGNLGSSGSPGDLGNLGSPGSPSNLGNLGSPSNSSNSSNPGAIQDMAAQAAAELGEITHLVYNAGYSQQKLFTEISNEEWEHMFAVHVHGAFHACQAVLPAMIRRKEGVILLISSIWGQIGASCEVHYSAAKAALEGMAKALAKEMGPSGIRVNGIAPGVIDTDMNRALGEDVLKSLAEDTALGRLGLPEEVAALAVFLSGSKAAYITGQIIGVNGGFLK